MKVYKYGCKPPTEGIEWCRLILSRANRYRNDLVELRDQRIAAKDDENKTIVKAKQRALRGACGLWYGTYALVERDAQRAKNFRRFDGTGRIGGYLNNGSKLAVASAMLGNKNFTLDRVGDHPTHHTLRMRIGGTAREPVFVVAPVKLHRPLPNLGTIVQCWIQVKRIGRKEKWELHLCVDSPSLVLVPGTYVQQGAIGLDLGWRQLEDRNVYRVAMTSDSEELTCPASIRSGLEHYERLTSTRRRAFDVFRPNDSFRSPDRLNLRVARGEFPELEGWRHADSHLWDWIANGRAKVLARRRQHYTDLARKLVRRYSTIVIEKLNLSKLATKENGVARGNRTDVAPAEFRLLLKAQAAKVGCLIVEVPAVNTTKECFLCRNLMDVGSQLHHQCEHCSAEHDQDVNAAKNLLRRWVENEPLADRVAAE